MKKLSNKKRKLKFIQEKNKLRLGVNIACDYLSISKDYYNDIDLLQVLTDKSKHIEFKYKLKFKYSWLNVGYNGLDFINNRVSIVISCSNNDKYKRQKDINILL